MAASLKIYSYDGNFRVHKALIAAQYNGVTVEVTKDFVLGKDNEAKEFVEKFPNKKVPAMDTPFGPVYESGAIARYIARIRPDTGLLGSNFYQQALVDQWIDWCGYELEVARGAWLYPLWKIAPFKESVHAAAKEEVHRCLKRLNEHLATRTYLVGNQVTLADITVICALVDLVTNVLTEKDVASVYTHLARWYTTCVNQPQFSEILKKTAWAPVENKVPGSISAHPSENKGEGEQKQEKKQKEKQEKPKKEGGDQKPKEQKPKEDKPKEQKPKEDKPKEPKKEEPAAKKEEPKQGGSKKDKKKGGAKAESS